MINVEDFLTPDNTDENLQSQTIVIMIYNFYNSVIYTEDSDPVHRNLPS